VHIFAFEVGMGLTVIPHSWLSPRTVVLRPSLFYLSQGLVIRVMMRTRNKLYILINTDVKIAPCIFDLDVSIISHLIELNASSLQNPIKNIFKSPE